MDRIELVEQDADDEKMDKLLAGHTAEEHASARVVLLFVNRSVFDGHVSCAPREPLRRGRACSSLAALTSLVAGSRVFPLLCWT
jgi:hypothetical protein